MDPSHHRHVRSFVRREGRITAAQQRALDELLSRYGVPEDAGQMDFTRLFGRDAETLLEIGFGNGASLARMAAEHPDNNYLGIEVYRPGVGKLLLQLEREDINNVRVLCADAMEVLDRQVPDHSLAGVLIFFPDPWPKKRHHKRRLVQREFIQLLASKLKQGGILHIATDWRDYAEYILEVMSEAGEFRNTAGAGHYAPRPGYRPLTKYERRGQRLGHEVYDLVFIRA
jgi:tRNA (guanine-N7-)-methyltransferase